MLLYISSGHELEEVGCFVMLDFSEAEPVLGVADASPLLVLGRLVSLTTVSCGWYARLTRRVSKLTCFLFVPAICFLVDTVTCVEGGIEQTFGGTLEETLRGAVAETL